MSSNLVSFEKLSKSNAPTKIVLDTNFILNLTHAYTNHPTNKNVSVCVDFMKSLAHDECEIFIPQIVINEFCHQVFLNVLSEYCHKHDLRINKVDLYKQKPHLIAPGHKQIKEAFGMLDTIISPVCLIENSIDVRRRAMTIMQKHHFLPSDAFISAIAMENNINAIATLDVYFGRNIVKENGMKVFMPEILLPR